MFIKQNIFYPLLSKRPFALISGKKFWNLFHLQPMRDQKVCTISNNHIKKYVHDMMFTRETLITHSVHVQQAEVQYFIGVQLDGSQHVEPLRNCIPEDTAKESEQLVSTFCSISFFLSFFLCFAFRSLSDFVTA